MRLIDQLSRSGLSLSHVRTDLPLRDRARWALEQLKQREARAESLAQATPEDLREAGRALAMRVHLAQNLQNYARHVASLTETRPIHLNSLGHISNCVQKASAELDDALQKIYGAVPPEEVTEAEVEEVVADYVAAQKS